VDDAAARYRQRSAGKTLLKSLSAAVNWQKIRRKTTEEMDGDCAEEDLSRAGVSNTRKTKNDPAV